MLIDFDYLVKKYKINAKGVLHLGASEGQEAPTYAKYGYKMAFVEALPDVYAKLTSNVKGLNAECYNACVSDTQKEVTFNVANNGGQSSSYLKFGTHTRMHPEVRFTNKLTMVTTTVNELIDNLEDYDILVMDLQGAELDALKGTKLDGFKWIYTEVNFEHVYKDCALVNELDNYLYDFKRVETKKLPGLTWADALYILS